MKNHLIIIIFIFIANLIQAQVYVKGYTRKNGTYVAPHYRSSPDKNPYNNYSYPGNTNPYTGKTAQGNPDTYLENYYNKKNSNNNNFTREESISYDRDPSILNQQNFKGSSFIISYNYKEKRFPTYISIDRIMYQILNIDDYEFYLTNANSIPIGYIYINNGKITKISDLRHNEVPNINFITK